MAVPQEPEALRQAITEALGLSSEGCGDARAAEAYRYALDSSWEQMQRVVGLMGAVAIMEHAVRVASRRYPRVALVTVGEDGLDLSALEAGDEGDDGPWCEGLEELCIATFRTLVELTGEVIAGVVLEELKGWSGRQSEA